MTNYVPTTASGLSSLDAAALSRTAWKTGAKEEMVRDSIFAADSLQTKYTVIGGEVVIDRPGMVLDVTNVGKPNTGGGQSVICAIRLPLDKAPQEGTGENALGNEDEATYRYAQMYYNEIKKSQTWDEYGYNANDVAYLGHKAAQGRQLTRFHSEWTDFRFHQAAIFRYAQELTHAPVSLTQELNKNWGIINLDSASFPTWDTDTEAHTDGAIDALNYYSAEYYGGGGNAMSENVADAMLAGSGQGATPITGFGVPSLSIIHDHVDDEMVIEGFSLDNGNKKILTLANKVWNWMINPSNTDSIAQVFANINDYRTDKRPTLPGELGALFGGEWILVKDPRAPTLTISGANGSWMITPGYVRPGNNDDRNKTAWGNTSGSSNFVFHTCMLLGANAFGRYTRDDLTTDLFETTEYGKRKGQSSYMGDGIQLVAYDRGTRTATSQIQRGCMIIPVPGCAVGDIYTSSPA